MFQSDFSVEKVSEALVSHDNFSASQTGKFYLAVRLFLKS